MNAAKNKFYLINTFIASQKTIFTLFKFIAIQTNASVIIFLMKKVCCN